MLADVFSFFANARHRGDTGRLSIKATLNTFVIHGETSVLDLAFFMFRFA